MDTGATAQVTRVQFPPPRSPGARRPLAGRSSCRCPRRRALVKPLEKPEGPRWAAPPKVVEKARVPRRRRGLPQGHAQSRLRGPRRRGTPRQLNRGSVRPRRAARLDAGWAAPADRREPDPTASTIPPIPSCTRSGWRTARCARSPPARVPITRRRCPPDGRHVPTSASRTPTRATKHTPDGDEPDGGGRAPSWGQASIVRSRTPAWSPKGDALVVQFEDEGR